MRWGLPEGGTAELAPPRTPSPQHRPPLTRVASRSAGARNRCARLPLRADGVLTFCDERVPLEEVDEEAETRWAGERERAESAAEERAAAAVRKAEQEEQKEQKERQEQEQEGTLSLFGEGESEGNSRTRPSPATASARAYDEAMAAWEEGIRGGADPYRWTEEQRQRKLSIRGTWVHGRLHGRGVLRKGGRSREAEWKEGQCTEADLAGLPGLRGGCTARFAVTEPHPAGEGEGAEEATPSPSLGRADGAGAGAQTGSPAPAEEVAFAFDGAHYSGEWRHYAPHGRGTLSYSDGSVYEGDLAGYRAEGSGRLTRPSEAVLQGQWRHGAPNGWARLRELPQRVLAGQAAARGGGDGSR